jgi:hypothetical protein
MDESNFKRNIVISADHRGSCIMAINYDMEYSSITITIDDVIRDVNSRAEIVKEIETMVKTRYNGHKPNAISVIDNKFLGEYLQKFLHPKNIGGYKFHNNDDKLPADKAEALYKLRCAIGEKMIQAGKHTDLVELELSEIQDAEIINSHTIRCLMFILDLYLRGESSFWVAAANIRKLGL